LGAAKTFEHLWATFKLFDVSFKLILDVTLFLIFRLGSSIHDLKSVADFEVVDVLMSVSVQDLRILVGCR
jgi:hypothetical protein